MLKHVCTLITKVKIVKLSFILDFFYKNIALVIIVCYNNYIYIDYIDAYYIVSYNLIIFYNYSNYHPWFHNIFLKNSCI